MDKKNEKITPKDNIPKIKIPLFDPTIPPPFLKKIIEDRKKISPK